MSPNTTPTSLDEQPADDPVTDRVRRALRLLVRIALRDQSLPFGALPGSPTAQAARDLQRAGALHVEIFEANGFVHVVPAWWGAAA